MSIDSNGGYLNHPGAIPSKCAKAELKWTRPPTSSDQEKQLLGFVLKVVQELPLKNTRPLALLGVLPYNVEWRNGMA